MAKLTLTDVDNLLDTTTAETAINRNSALTEVALENTLSRDGTSPNHMNASIDMNSNHLYGLPAPVASTSPLRLEDLSDFVGGGTVTNIPEGGDENQILGKASPDDFDVEWVDAVSSVGLALPADFTVTNSPVTTAGTLTGAWATNPTGTGAIVRAVSPTLTGTVNINGSLIETGGTITTPNLILAGSSSGTTSVISAAAASGTITIPSATDTLVGKATTDTLTNKTLTAPVMTTPTLGVATATSINKVAITAPASAATLTIPDGVTLTGPALSGTAMTLGNTETVTGVKTFGSAGAVGRLRVAGTTSGSTTLDATAVASGTLTLPAATDTLVGKATTDTFTNKTFNTAGTGNVFQINGTGITAVTGTGSAVLASSPTITTPTIATINRATTAGVAVQGRADAGTPTTGYIGEYVEGTLSSGSATSLVTGTAKTIISISLTAGEWDVYGYVNYVQAGSTNITSLLTSISTVDNTRGTEELVTSFGGSGITGGANPAGFTPFARIPLSSTTTLYLIAVANFTVSTCSAWGKIRARRVG